MFELPPLPYGYDALAPIISDQTLHFHHDKHHATYFKTLNDLLKESGSTPSSLEEVILSAANSDKKKLFNNAGQAWNHTFFWASMTPDKEKPAGDLAAAISSSFENLDGLKTAFVTEGAGHFGSGWVWLASDQSGTLKVLSTHDAQGALTHAELTPLLVCDLWEHAYYLDYQNNRKGFLEAWFDALPHWSLAGSQYAAAKGGGVKWTHPAPVS